MTQKIKFVSITEDSYENDLKPSPASNWIPEWFKKIPKERHNPNPMFPTSRSNSTIKKCTPYLDALTTGYMYVLPFDIEVTLDADGEKRLVWGPLRNGSDVLEIESSIRIDGVPIPKEFDQYAWRFLNNPSIDTPKGYSVLITHPLNRQDLPFLTLSGVIDSDNFYMPMAITFFLKKDFVGILPKGTPLAQILPFKRVDWTHEVTPPLPKKEKDSWEFKLRSVINRSYSKQFWSRKSYK